MGLVPPQEASPFWPAYPLGATRSGVITWLAIHPAVFLLPLEAFPRQVGTVGEGSLLEA